MFKSNLFRLRKNRDTIILQDILMESRQITFMTLIQNFLNIVRHTIEMILDNNEKLNEWKCVFTVTDNFSHD